MLTVQADAFNKDDISIQPIMRHQLAEELDQQQHHHHINSSNKKETENNINDDIQMMWSVLRYATHESTVESVKCNPRLAQYVSDWGNKLNDFGYKAMLNDMEVISKSDNLGDGIRIVVGAAWVQSWSKASDVKMGSEESHVGRGYGFVAHNIPELAIAILPNYRNMGVGTKLLRAILHEAKDRKLNGISLSVRDGNPAIRLYQRLGFIILHGTERKNRVGGYSFIMLHKLWLR